MSWHTTRALALLFGASTIIVATGCAVVPHASGQTLLVAPAQARQSLSTPAETTLPGLGPVTRGQVPVDADQVVVVTGAGRAASTSTVVLYQRTGTGSDWQAGQSWPAHNGRDGWTVEHHNGDLRSPIGVFTLTDAGGLLPSPGTRLPYDQSRGFTIRGTGFNGESLAKAFDYVIAINYNRVPGKSPLDWTMPLGAARGGQIWLHVDHGGSTHGCVSLAIDAMITLLRTLDPNRHPVVVMGDAATLAR